MNKVITVILGLVGLLSLVFLTIIIATGDAEIGMGEASGSINMFMYLSYLVFVLASILVVAFTVKHILNNPYKLKSAVKGLVLFTILSLISYFGLSTGKEVPLSDGGVLSASESKLVESELFLFYVFLFAAVGSMLFFGIKKIMR